MEGNERKKEGKEEGKSVQYKKATTEYRNSNIPSKTEYEEKQNRSYSKYGKEEMNYHVIASISC